MQTTISAYSSSASMPSIAEEPLAAAAAAAAAAGSSAAVGVVSPPCSEGMPSAMAGSEGCGPGTGQIELWWLSADMYSERHCAAAWYSCGSIDQVSSFASSFSRIERTADWYTAGPTSPISAAWKAWQRVCSSCSSSRISSTTRSPPLPRIRSSAALCDCRTVASKPTHLWSVGRASGDGAGAGRGAPGCRKSWARSVEDASSVSLPTRVFRRELCGWEGCWRGDEGGSLGFDGRRPTPTTRRSPLACARFLLLAPHAQEDKKSVVLAGVSISLHPDTCQRSSIYRGCRCIKTASIPRETAAQTITRPLLACPPLRTPAALVSRSALTQRSTTSPSLS